MDKYEKFWKILSNKEKDKIMQAYGEIAFKPENVIVCLDTYDFDTKDKHDQDNLRWVYDCLPSDSCTIKAMCKELKNVLPAAVDGDKYDYEAISDENEDGVAIGIIVSVEGNDLGVLWFDFDDESDAKRVLSIVKWLNSHLK